MKLNIEIELSEEQFEKLKNTGELSIKIASNEAEPNSTLSIWNGKEIEQWPDAKGNKYAELIIETARHCGLSPSELPKISRCRVWYIINSTFGIQKWDERIVYGFIRGLHRFDEEEVIEVEKCLKLKFVDGDLDDDSNMIGGKFTVRVYNALIKKGVLTMTDLKTMTIAEIRKMPNIGKNSIQEIEDKLKEFKAKSQ